MSTDNRALGKALRGIGDMQRVALMITSPEQVHYGQLHNYEHFNWLRHARRHGIASSLIYDVEPYRALGKNVAKAIDVDMEALVAPLPPWGGWGRAQGYSLDRPYPPGRMGRLFRNQLEDERDATRRYRQRH